MYLLVTSRLFHEDSTRFDNKFQETTVKLPTETYSVSVIDLRYYYRYQLLPVLVHVPVCAPSLDRFALQDPCHHPTRASTHKTFETLKTEESQGLSPWLLIYFFFAIKTFCHNYSNIRNKYSIILETHACSCVPPPLSGRGGVGLGTQLPIQYHQSISGISPKHVGILTLFWQFGGFWCLPKPA